VALSEEEEEEAEAAISIALFVGLLLDFGNFFSKKMQGILLNSNYLLMLLSLSLFCPLVFAVADIL